MSTALWFVIEMICTGDWPPTPPSLGSLVLPLLNQTPYICFTSCTECTSIPSSCSLSHGPSPSPCKIYTPPLACSDSQVFWCNHWLSTAQTPNPWHHAPFLFSLFMSASLERIAKTVIILKNKNVIDSRESPVTQLRYTIAADSMFTMNAHSMVSHNRVSIHDY